MHRLIAVVGIAGMLLLGGCDNGDAPPAGAQTTADVDRMMKQQQANPAAAPAASSGGSSGGPASGSPAGTSPADPLAGQSGSGGPVGSSLPPSGR